MEGTLYPDKDPEELETFYPDIWFWDENIPGKIKKYDFNYLLRRRRVRFISKEEIIHRVKEYFHGAELEEILAELQKDRVLGYAEVLGIRDKAAKLYWKLPVIANRLKRRITRLDRLILEVEDSPELKEQLYSLFQSEEKKSWIVFFTPQSVKELRETLRLPPMFRIYPARNWQGREWSIAFNSDAFQLWSLLGETENGVF
jgi:hypothetical protein